MYYELLKLNRLVYLLSISLLIIFFTYFIQSTYLTESVFYNTYAANMSSERIELLLENIKKYQWLGYSLLPVLLLIKVLYNSFILITGTLLVDRNFRFPDLFNVCLKAEMVFLLMFVGKIITLNFFKHIDVTGDINFIPVSLANFFTTTSLPKWLIYPMQTFNIWEVLYCIVGSCLFAAQFDMPRKKAALLFCGSYISGLLIIMVISIFLILSFS